MFELIKERILEEGKLNKSTFNNIELICVYWSSVSSQIVEVIRKITEKYAYESIKKIRRPDSSTTHLEYWKEIGQFSLTPAIEDHDTDLEFIHFVKDFQDEQIFEIYSQPQDSELDFYQEYLDRLFYTWIGFLWQVADGKSGGIPTCTVENNSTRMFYFNDFLFDDFSTYHNIWEDRRISGSHFTRDLEPIEIYARTNRNFKWPEREIIWEFKQGNEIIRMGIINNETTVQIGVQIDRIKHRPDKSYDNSDEIASRYFLALSNKFLNEGWKLKEVKSR